MSLKQAEFDLREFIENELFAGDEDCAPKAGIFMRLLEYYVSQAIEQTQERLDER